MNRVKIKTDWKCRGAAPLAKTPVINNNLKLKTGSNYNKEFNKKKVVW